MSYPYGPNIQRDYHGWKLHDALFDVERHISVIREKRDCKDLELITGHGVIQHETVALLKRYGLNPTIQLGNSGVVICTVE